MDPSFSQFPIFNDQTLLPDMLNEYPSGDPFKDLSFLDPNPTNSGLSSTFSPEGDDLEFSDGVLKYINQVLMEEDMESKPCMFHDPLTLQATEESLYEVIGGGKCPTPQDQSFQNPLCFDHNVQSPEGGYSSGSFSDSSSSPGPSNDSCLVNPQFVETRSSLMQNPIPENFVFQSPPRATTRSSSNRSGKGNGNVMVGSYRSELMVSDAVYKNDLLLQFNRGAEEGSKFLPKGQMISAEGNRTYVAKDSNAGNVVISTQNGSEHSCVGSRGKKYHRREDTDLEEGRSNKQSAVYMDDEEGELSDIFDKVLLCKPVESNDDQVSQSGANNVLQQDLQSVENDNGKVHDKGQRSTKKVIDLRALLILCAQAVSVDDRDSATELLRQIMQHSSPFGDSAQRLAHCFANALEARLAGTGTQLYTALSSKRMSAADMLKFYQAYIAACPFMKMAMIFANHNILKAAEKADTLHIIDFGILYGFQWPALIHCLSRRPGGPPNLRITGVELPLSGFRPEERVQETGHRLARYCKRFNVPFEYYAIAKKWETVQFDDLKVQRNEVLAVNCLCRFKNLLDETVLVTSPRDTVLRLIRKLNPDVFVQCVVNGSYHAPFFVSRFREALFHFSALFDMFDTNLPREDPMRMGFEKEFIGREVLNIVACEGSERTVRPETYKQWQVRNLRAGFRQLPLDREVMNKIKEKMKMGYNPEFVVDENGRWMLQGWKGRIMFASTCWAPSRTDFGGFELNSRIQLFVNMDPTYPGTPDFMKDIDFESMLPSPSQFPGTPNQYQFNQLSPDFEFLSNQFSIPSEPESGGHVPPVSFSSEGESVLPNGGSSSVPTTVSPVMDSLSYDDDEDFSESVFKFVNQMLMEEEEEENIEPEQKPIVSYDPLGLRVTERSFYDVLGQQYSFSPDQRRQQPQQSVKVDQPNRQLLYDDSKVESPDSWFSGNSSDCNASSSPSTNTSNSVDFQSLSDSGEQKLSVLQTSIPTDSVYQFSSHSNSQLSVPLTNSLSSFGDGMSESSVNQFLAQNIYTDSESVLQFQRGLEEASKFLPKVSPLVIDLESSRVSPEVKVHAPTVIIKKGRSETKDSPSRQRGRRNSLNGSASTERKKSPNGSRRRKNHERNDVDSEEGRSSKQSAVYEMEEADELSEFFDRVLLFTDDWAKTALFCDNVDVQNEASKNLQPNGQLLTSNAEGVKARGNKQGKKKETVDLRSLLLLCAQAVSTNDFRTSTELLKQIRQNSSPFGDGFQRLAHCFANGLEARMAGAGTKTQVDYISIASKGKAVDKLKEYHIHLSASPFKKMAIFFKNKMIYKVAEKAATLHIVDFGIMYGFQWPILIHKLSKRPGGPPKLRITGIEVPQRGFRPAEWIEETGRRLARYCERFKVPFEFNAIASQNWESIKVEDLKVERNEVLAVNCMLRFKNLLDETVEVDCPRDSVLKLIRSLKPDIFVHTIINGAYNAPFFVTRFREALFHFSAMFDAFDATMPRDSPERLRGETLFYGVEAMNVIACEGTERVERAETYKQWQVRCQRAGLKVLPLDQELLKAFRDRVKEVYHKDFAIDQDCDWMLQGWRGRTVYASSCWVPA
ncbi:uncharacterized protein LOC126787434 [Argentina anserina]|uniref:uncharacterized protein LOC126787434 n=1 Tax=Argentina anserina TaxID=57926 RepID=UPI002176834D|nr:uncharacterized protein LOC126787434 [Potentilla anserina]